LVNRLEAQALVVRTPATDDRRQVNLSLTPRGEEMLAGLSAAHRAELRQIGPELNALLTQLNKTSCSDTRPAAKLWQKDILRQQMPAYDEAGEGAQDANWVAQRDQGW
jgi:hypothetical protein